MRLKDAATWRGTVLLVHNYYQQAGGEDCVFADEQALLATHGHRVVTFTRSNHDIRPDIDLRAAAATFWNQDAYIRVRALIKEQNVDVIHCHNTFPLVSPSVYWAARSQGVAVVQTIHNYRLACAGATFYRAGHICEDCLTTATPLPAIRHRCYRSSLTATTVLCAMTGVHRALGSYRDKVTLYVVLNEFMRAKLIAAGLPAERIRVKPNSILNDPGAGRGAGGYALFMGRLAREKGIEALCRVWSTEPGLPPLVVAGDGPLRGVVEMAAQHGARIQLAGVVGGEEKLRMLREARFLVVPSEWYEGFPKVVQEAYAVGLPVLASRLGGLAEGIVEGVTGLCFDPGCDADFAAQARRLAIDDALVARLRTGARSEYETRYTAEKNYTALAQIYCEAIELCGGAQG